ncbi:MAG: SRPBCC domain-containing protein, partial [Anaerolineales bacterium]
MSSQTLTFTQSVNNSPESLYDAFTNATQLREWLCNVATVVPRPGGRIYLWWNSGYYTSGEFTHTESGKEVSFTWHGRGEPDPTQVKVSFKAQDSSTLVSLDHSGMGTGDEWEQTISEIDKGWKTSLKNLASVQETGEDIRFIMRPMLGIILDEFNPEIARRLGTPISEGIRLSGAVEGMGADSADL